MNEVLFNWSVDFNFEKSIRIIVIELITEKFIAVNVDINAQIRTKFTIVAKPNDPSLFSFLSIQM